jgi:hypothetical protein
MTQNPRETERENGTPSGSQARTFFNRQQQKTSPHHDPSQDRKAVKLRVLTGDCTGEGYEEDEDYFDSSEELPRVELRPEQGSELTKMTDSDDGTVATCDNSIELEVYFLDARTVWKQEEQTATTPSTTNTSGS